MRQKIKKGKLEACKFVRKIAEIHIILKQLMI